MRAFYPFAAATLVAMDVAAQTPPSPAAPDLATRLAEAFAVGRDSAAALVREERARVPGVVERMLRDRARMILAARVDSAAATLETARSLADLHSNAVGDSFLVGAIAFQESREPRALDAALRAWSSYDDVVALGENWGAIAERLPALRRDIEAAADPYLELRLARIAARCKLVTTTPGESRQEYEHALDLARRLGDRTSARAFAIEIGRTHLAEDHLDEALEIIEPVRAIADSAEDVAAYLGASEALASIHLLQGRVPEARAVLEAALPRARAAGSRAWEGRLSNRLADALGFEGRYAEAMEVGRRARAIQHEAGQRGPELGTIISLVWLASTLERHSEALVLAQEGVRLAEELGQREARSILQVQLGQAYLQLARVDEALAHYERALPLAREFGGLRHEAAVLHGIATCRRSLGDIDGAIDACRRALETIRGAHIPITEGTILVDLGRAYDSKGAYADAEATLRRAMSVGHALGNPVMIGEAERALGHVLASTGRSDEALPLLREAAKRGRAAGAPALLRDALAEEAKLAQDGGDLARADSLLSEAVALAETGRGLQSGEEVRVGYLEDKRRFFVQLAELRHERGDAEGAFEVSERAHARVLLDVLGGDLPDPRQHVDPEVLSREDALRARLASVQSALSMAASAEEWSVSVVDSLRRVLESVMKDYRAVREEIGTRDPAWAALVADRRPIPLVDLRSKALATDQILVEYLVGREATIVFLVAQDRCLAFDIAVSEDSLGTLVDELRDDLASAEGPPPSAGRLHAILVGPLVAEIPPGARLLVVADGPLHRLPFAALHDGSSYLVERHALAFAPSASVLDPALGRRRPRRPGARACLAIGDPSTFRTDALLSPERGGVPWRFGELPYAAEEARRTAARFPRATLLIGETATEERVKAGIGAATHVHFATHGVLVDGEPLQSGLLLAQDDDPAEDGFLQTHEILDLDLDADLVVLSACDTGLGALVRGEGMLGLARSFLHAGVGALVMSLWEVVDRSAMDLMDEMYAGLVERNLPPDVALQRAQVAALSAGRAPRDWASFVAVGRMRSPRADGKFPAWLILAGLAVGAGSLTLAFRSAARRAPAA
jgi:CHAT domain-containing protein/tetratricopeptide (TPR) repeat protein